MAETLITLAIIGIVAALTIPSVVRNYQKQQTVTKLKKVYSALSNTTNLAIADNGPIAGWEVKNNDEGGIGQGSIDFANRYLIPYLKVSKNCKNDSGSGCIFWDTSLNTTLVHSLSPDWARFFLNDGTFIAINTTINETYTRAMIAVDLNGQKKPNRNGKDIFYFNYYTNNNFRPQLNGKFTPDALPEADREALLNYGSYCCNKEKTGHWCAALIMKDSWQISDDYPWN